MVYGPNCKVDFPIAWLTCFNFKYQYSLGFLADRSLIVGDISWQL
jgi:hypothetical protein